MGKAPGLQLLRWFAGGAHRFTNSRFHENRSPPTLLIRVYSAHCLLRRLTDCQGACPTLFSNGAPFLPQRIADRFSSLRREEDFRLSIEGILAAKEIRLRRVFTPTDHHSAGFKSNKAPTVLHNATARFLPAVSRVDTAGTTLIEDMSQRCRQLLRFFLFPLSIDTKYLSSPLYYTRLTINV